MQTLELQAVQSWNKCINIVLMHQCASTQSMPAAVTYFYKITKDKLTKVCMLTKCTQRKFHGHHLEQDETPTSQQLASTEKGAATMLQSIQDVLTFNAVVIQDSFSQCRCQPSNKQYSNSRCQCVTMEWSNLQPFFHPPTSLLSKFSKEAGTESI